MADERIEEIKERLERATPGEWKASGNGVHVGTHCVAIAYDPTGDRMTGVTKANARLIAHAPSDIRFLLSEVERLRRMIQYALDGPDDINCLKSILFDALNGCTGAENVDEIRAKYGEWGAADGRRTFDEFISAYEVADVRYSRKELLDFARKAYEAGLRAPAAPATADGRAAERERCAAIARKYTDAAYEADSYYTKPEKRGDIGQFILDEILSGAAPGEAGEGG